MRKVIVWKRGIREVREATVGSHVYTLKQDSEKVGESIWV